MKWAVGVAILMVLPAVLAQGNGTINNSTPTAELVRAETEPLVDVVQWRVTDANGEADIQSAQLLLDGQQFDWNVPRSLPASPPREPGWSAWDARPGDGSLMVQYRRETTAHDAVSTWHFQGADEEAPTPTVTTNLTRINQLPQAHDDQYLVLLGRTLDIGQAQGVLANDVDEHPLVATLLEAPRSGTLDLQPNGAFTFVPEEAGPFTFTYQISDGAATATARAHIAVTGNETTSSVVPAATIHVEAGGSLTRLLLAPGSDTGELESITFENTANPEAPAVVDFANIIQRNGDEASVQVSSQLSIARKEPAGNIALDLPAGLTATSDASWDGTFLAPTFESTEDYPGAVLRFSIGRSDGDILLSAPVALRVDGEAGREVVMTWSAGEETLPGCGTSGASNAPCVASDGADLIIWTTHFSTFTLVTPATDGTTNESAVPADEGGWLRWLWVALPAALLLAVLVVLIVRRRRPPQQGLPVVIDARNADR